jgi:hypothetical protein
MDSQILSSLIAVVGTLAGAAVGIFAQRDAKKQIALTKRVERYRNEIRARQAEEDVAAQWLSELLPDNTSPIAAKKALRDRVETQRGLRPDIPPSEVRE